MIKILLIDDEQRATDALRLMIEKCISEPMKIQSCNNARMAAEIIHQFQPELIFLDIHMPYLSGFELLNRIPTKNFQVIFTTAYNEYAIKAIRFSAFDYLLKPVDAEELIETFTRYLEMKDMHPMQAALLQNISYNMQSGRYEAFRLALPTQEGVHFVLPHEIIRCEALNNYTRFYLVDKKQILISKTLGEYASLLSSFQFIRTHKSHLVNKQFISFIDHDGFVVLNDGTRVEVSRRRKDEVLQNLKQGN